ncbi:DUF4861 family protein, partial [Formosa algae]
MKTNILFSCAIAAALLSSCGKQDSTSNIITVKNTLDVSRSFETVEILKSDLQLDPTQDFERLAIRDVESKTVMVSQFVDQDLDGTSDVLLFQPELSAQSEKQFELFVADANLVQDTTAYCYSRFVPERTDDYTWENNRVGFRTYGPVAQKMIEDSIPGGTLSSG